MEMKRLNWLEIEEDPLPEKNGKNFEDWQKEYLKEHPTPLMRWLMYGTMEDLKNDEKL